jgi:hypothetical protein
MEGGGEGRRGDVRGLVSRGSEGRTHAPLIVRGVVAERGGCYFML